MIINCLAKYCLADCTELMGESAPLDSRHGKISQSGCQENSKISQSAGVKNGKISQSEKNQYFCTVVLVRGNDVKNKRYQLLGRNKKQSI